VSEARVYGLSANAAAGVERQPGRGSGDFEVLSANEVEALARAASSAQDRALFTTAAYAGLRLGELRALRWRDVDFSKRLIHVRRSYVLREEGVPKSGRVRSVPLIGQVARALDELSRRDQFIGDEDLVSMIYVHHVPQLDAAEKLSRALESSSAAANVATTGQV
jgi:integrase